MQEQRKRKPHKKENEEREQPRGSHLEKKEDNQEKVLCVEKKIKRRE